MQFSEWKNRSKAYRKAVAAAGDAKKVESLCRAAFVAGVDWGVETHDAKVGFRKTANVDAAWWALVMGAAAALEDAANCLQDPDAKKAAEGAAKHYRAQALLHNASLSGGCRPSA